MSSTRSAARYCKFFLLASAAPLCLSQTVEIVTGAGRYVDVPDTTVPVAPNSIVQMAIAPDGRLYLSDLGARTFRVTSKDSVNFTASKTATYFVESAFHFSEFLPPVMPPPTLNLDSRGALVPIHWQLPNSNGTYVTNPASFVSATVGSLSCGSATAIPLNDTASGPAGLSFDASTNTFTYHWQTNASWTGCRKLTIKFKDQTTHELRFRFQ